jgi:hypothetical protein
MIINYPTGLYVGLNSEDNVTWHISNNEPRRSADAVIRIPFAEEIRPLPLPEFDDQSRRSTYGELIYTINDTSKSQAGSGTKAFAEGDVIDFQDGDAISIGIPRSNRIEFKHNNNQIDLESAGLTEEDIDELNSSAFLKKKELDEEFASLRTFISDIETGIVEVQKNINETNKALSAVSVLGDDELTEKISHKLTEYQDQLNDLTQLHEEKLSELDAVVDQINKLDVVVK